MSKKERIRLLIGAAINLAIFAIEVYCLIVFIKYIQNGNQDIRFRYYTNISNLTVGFIALPNAFFLIYSVIKGKFIYPKVLSIIKFAGISMIALTFFTVIFILVPITSFEEMYKDLRLITHLIAPLMAFASYYFFEEKDLFKWKLSFLAIIPTVIYAIVYVTNVVYMGTWPDLYQVNRNGLGLLFVLIEVLFGLGLIQGLYFLKKLANKLRFVASD